MRSSRRSSSRRTICQPSSAQARSRRGPCASAGRRRGASCGRARARDFCPARRCRCGSSHPTAAPRVLAHRLGKPDRPYCLDHVQLEMRLTRSRRADTSTSQSSKRFTPVRPDRRMTARYRARLAWRDQAEMPEVLGGPMESVGIEVDGQREQRAQRARQAQPVVASHHVLVSIEHAPSDPHPRRRMGAHLADDGDLHPVHRHRSQPVQRRRRRPAQKAPIATVQLGRHRLAVQARARLPATWNTPGRTGVDRPSAAACESTVLGDAQPQTSWARSATPNCEWNSSMDIRRDSSSPLLGVTRSARTEK